MSRRSELLRRFVREVLRMDFDDLKFVDLQQTRDECVKLQVEAHKTLFTTQAILDAIEARKAWLFEHRRLDSIEVSCYRKEQGLEKGAGELEI